MWRQERLIPFSILFLNLSYRKKSIDSFLIIQYNPRLMKNKTIRSLAYLLVFVHLVHSLIRKDQSIQGNQTVKYLDTIDVPIPSSKGQGKQIINIQFSQKNNHQFRADSTNMRISQYIMCVATIEKSQIYENLQNLSHKFFVGKHSKQFQEIDLNGLSLGKEQYINLRYQGNQTSVKLKIALRYFGPPQINKSLDFTVTVEVSNQKKCPLVNNGQYDPNSADIFHCEPAKCQHLFSGYDCSNRRQIINSQQLFKATLNQFQRINLVIPIASAFPLTGNSRRLQGSQVGLQIPDTNQISQQNQTNTIILQMIVKSSDCVIYFQQSLTEDPTANPFNYYLAINTSSNNSQGNTRIYSLTLTGNSSQYVSVTFEKYTVGTAQIGVYFRDADFSLLMSSILVLISILVLCGFTIFMAWTFARLRSLQRGINQIHITIIPRRVKLTRQSIDRYFPIITYQDFLEKKIQIDSSVENLILQKRHRFKQVEEEINEQKLSRQEGNNLLSHSKETKFSESQVKMQILQSQDNKEIKQQLDRSTFLSKFSEESECSICIVKIQRYQGVSITYCGHIFHSECLYRWFQNQTNCPYCRKQFTSQNIQALYLTVAGEANLTESQLAMAIYKNRVFSEIHQV